MERLITDAEELDTTFKATRDTNGDLSMSYADIVDAIHIVQENMGITGTTAKESATTIEGSIKTMKSAWTNFSTGLADENADVSGLFDKLTKSIDTVVDNISPKVSTALKSIANVIKEKLPDFVENVGGKVGDLLPDMLDAVTSLVTSIGDSMPKVLESLSSAVGDALPSVVKAIVDSLPTFLKDAPASIGKAVSNLLPDVIDAIIDLAANLPNLLVNGIIGIFEGAGSIITGLYDGISDQLKAAVPEDIAEGMVGEVKNKFSTTWESGMTNLKLTLSKILGNTDWEESLKTIKLAQDLQNKIVSDYNTAKANIEKYSFENFQIEVETAMNAIATYQGLLEGVTNDDGTVTNVKLAQAYIDKLNEQLGSEVYKLNSVGLTMAVELSSEWANEVDPYTLAQTIVGEINGMEVPTPDAVSVTVLKDLQTGYATGSLTKEQLQAEIDALDISEEEKQETYYYILLKDLSSKFNEGSMTWEEVKAEIDTYDLTDKEKDDYFKYVVSEKFVTGLETGSMTWQDVQDEINSYDMTDEEKKKLLHYIAETKFSDQLQSGSKTWAEVIAMIDAEIASGLADGTYDASTATAERSTVISCIAYTTYMQDYSNGTSPEDMKAEIQADLTLSDEDKAMMMDVIDFIDLQIKYQNGELDEAGFNSKVDALKNLPSEVKQQFVDNVATFSVEYDEQKLQTAINDMVELQRQAYQTSLIQAFSDATITNMQNFSTAVNAAKEAQTNLNGEISESDLEGYRKLVNDATIALNAQEETAKEMYTQMGMLTMGYDAGSTELDAYVESCMNSDTSIKNARNTVQSMTDELGEMTGELANNKGGWGTLNGEVATTTQTLLTNATTWGQIQSALGITDSQTSTLKSTLDSLTAEGIQPTSGAIIEWLQKQSETNSEVSRGTQLCQELGLSEEELKRVLVELAQKQSIATDEIEDASKAVDEATDKNDDFSDSVKDINENVGTEAKYIEAKWAGLFKGVIPSELQYAVDAAKKAGVNIPDSITEGLENKTLSVEEAAKAVMDVVTKAQTDPIDNGEIQGNAEAAGDAYAQGLKNKEGEVSQAASDIADTVDAETKVSDETQSNTTDAMNAIVTEVGNKLDSIGTAFSQIVMKASEKLGVNSAFQTNMKAYGGKIPTLMASGSNENQYLIENAITAIMTAISTILYPLSSNMQNYGAYSSRGLATGLYSEYGTVYSSAYSLMTAISNGLGGTYESMYNVGYYGGQGLANGLSAMWYTVYYAAASLANAARSGAQITLRVQSPSKVFQEIGQYVGEGLAIGIDESSDDVYNTASTLAEGLVSEFNGVSADVGIATSTAPQWATDLTKSINNLGIYLDGDVMIGHLINRIDSGLNDVSAKSKRGNVAYA